MANLKIKATDNCNNILTIRFGTEMNSCTMRNASRVQLSLNTGYKGSANGTANEIKEIKALISTCRTSAELARKVTTISYYRWSVA